MNPAFRSCQRLQKFTLNRALTYRHNYSTQRPLPSQSPVLRSSTLQISRIGAPRHTSVSARKASTMASEPRFAEGLNPDELRPSLNELLGQGWGLDEDNIGIKKTFYFKSYFKAVSFLNAIASQSSVKKHHASMTIRFGSVDIHWTTHNPRGLTDKDISLAQFCEQAAELMGAVQEGQGLKCGPTA
ncbi:4a-hydroxytetrahydrobiopterin dehydratase [Aspergillus stella-maris]|uniref:4a-hydroxytetrahydrobiopterin dehydratase n=1 Tax=Aspergillus stella-maris TaxID=1810926 RepID=UPI003CCD4881